MKAVSDQAHELTEETKPAGARKRRRWLNWILIPGFTLLALSGWLRLWQALRLGELLNELAPRPGLTYLAVSGALVGLAGLAAIAALLSRHPLRGWTVRGISLLAALWYWIDRLLFTAEGGNINWPFSLALTLLCLALVWGGLALEEHGRKRPRD